MSGPSVSSPGQLLPKILAGSWRAQSAPLEIGVEELSFIAPHLVGAGAAGLAWRRIRHTDLRATEAGVQLQQAHRYQALRATLFAREIESALALFRAAGIEPVLVKGWAVARLYPEAGLRHYGDIDLCVRRAQYRTAEALLAGSNKELLVDLHCEFSKLDKRSCDDLLARSQLVKLNETDVRVLSAEDHLRLLCVHFLRHGAWRPLWLCDVAALLEARPADFDWDRCLGENRRRAKWIACTIKLAHELLGAEIESVPARAKVKELPRWFAPAVLKQWHAPFAAQHELATPMSAILRRPRPAAMLRALRRRWPDPVTATVKLNASFNDAPRWPLQIGHYLALSLMCAARLTKLPHSSES